MNATVHAKPPPLPGVAGRQVKRKPKILIFVPHADDEIFLAGGLAVRAKKEIPEITIIAALMTAGFVPELADTRKKEFISSCELLGMIPKRFNFPLTRNIRVRDVGSNKPREVTILDPTNDTFIHTVAGVIIKEAPTAIIMPHERDWHPDHCATTSLVNSALLSLSSKNIPLNLMLLLARVWHDLSAPNLLVALDKATYLKKQEALRMHFSQLTSATTGKERITHNRYGIMLECIDRLSAVIGPEKILGPSSKDPGIEFAEIYSVSRVFSEGIGAKCSPRIILLNTPLTEDIFVS